MKCTNELSSTLTSFMVVRNCWDGFLRRSMAGYRDRGVLYASAASACEVAPRKSAFALTVWWWRSSYRRPIVHSPCIRILRRYQSASENDTGNPRIPPHLFTIVYVYKIRSFYENTTHRRNIVLLCRVDFDWCYQISFFRKVIF